MHTGVQKQIGPYRMMFGLFNNNSTGVARGTVTCLPFCKNISLPQVFSRDRAAQLLVFFVFFVKHCLSFGPFLVVIVLSVIQLRLPIIPLVSSNLS
jgi:hypothetical protein